MKHLARFLSLTILLTACAALVLAQDPKPQSEFVTDRPWPEYTPESWKEFSPKDGRFKVLLPDAPAEKVETLDSPFGKLDMHTFVMQTFAYYGIGYIDFPEKDGIRDADTFLRGAQAGHLAATKSELLEEKSDDRFASPGRYFKARVPGGYIKHVRLYLIKNRYYIIFIAVPEKAESAETLKFYEETVTKFLNSFKPTDLEGSVKAAPPGLPAHFDIDPALSKQPPSSRKGEPEPAAKVDGGVLNSKAVSLPRPVYPVVTRGPRTAGMLKVNVVVDESGRVIWARAVSGPVVLREAVEKAAYGVRFKPVTFEGKPEKMKGILLYRLN